MKIFSTILIALGFVFTIIGLIPVMFIYPFKAWQSSFDFWAFILFESHDRWYWQIGFLTMMVGLLLNKSTNKESIRV